MKTAATVISALLLFTVACSRPARAGVTFDRSAYDALASAGTQQTIPSGTQITVTNWQQYRKFMTIGLQALYSGNYQWKVPATGEYTITVGPTIPIALPKAEIADTEKYANQTRVVKLPNGGYSFTGYMAGVPFPDPKEPDLAAKVLFDDWLAFRPFVADYQTSGPQTDRYGNTVIQKSDVLQYRLDHLSDPPHPRVLEGGEGDFFTSRFMVIEPEQSKYTAQLAIYSDDPTKVQELYVFLPSLRRSMRLSSASRCSPILGSDYVQDDGLNGVGFQPTHFSLTFLGRKKILSMAHADSEASHRVSSFNLGLPMPGWPKPELGKWELRDAYVIDATPVPELRGYCYAHKVIYIDSQTYLTLFMDVYDAQGKLWKVFQNYYHPVPLNDGELVLVGNTTDVSTKDIQNMHATLSVAGPVVFDEKVPAELQNYQVWAFSSGLSRIMR